MSVLFDRATPVPIREFLIGHTVRTAAQEHWDTLKNGDLLTVASKPVSRGVATTQLTARPAIPNQLLKLWKPWLVASGVKVTCIKR